MSIRLPCARGNAGFTMIELILVLVILGILAVSALPNFLVLNTQAHIASRNDVATVVQIGIHHFRLQDIVSNGPPGSYPATLDALANGTQCGVGNPCFLNVTTNGVTDANWRKVTNAQYQYSIPSGATFTYDYSTVSGAFAQ